MTIARNKGSTRFQDLSAAKNPLPSAELDKEFNDIVEWINDNIQLTQNISEWALHENTPTFVSGTDFTISGDQEAVFTAGRALKPNLNGTYVYTHVKSSVYSGGSGLTTVVCHDNVLTSSLTQIYFALLDPAHQSVPRFDQRDRGCLIGQISTGGISDQTWEQVSWNSEVYDTDTFHDNSTNPSRITVGSGVSKIKFTVYIYFAGNATGYRQARIRKNGTWADADGFPHIIVPAEANGNAFMVVSGILSVSENDYFEVEVWQNSGSALNLFHYSWCMMEVIK